MARIRTIKPEFPQSESMGKISRDARLLFIQMWTLADDSGRLRGNSRMLASLLFPYDEDARGLISTWMEELISEGCITCYHGPEGSSYVAINHWTSHQKIDKPSKSKLPEPPSIMFANLLGTYPNPREISSEDQGSRIKEGTKDQGVGEEAKKSSLSDVPGFDTAWDMWLRHRIEKQKPMGSIEQEAQLMELVRFGPDAKEIVEFSIRKGALNLITNGDHKRKQVQEESRSKTSASVYKRPGVQSVVMCADLTAHTGGEFRMGYNYDQHIDDDGKIIPFEGGK